MAYIIIGLMIGIFSMGMLNTDFYIWGWGGIAIGGFSSSKDGKIQDLMRMTDIKPGCFQAAILIYVVARE